MIISVINQKGGVGKTTTAVNLAVGMALTGQPTLLVDLDPQGNATSGVGLTAANHPTLYDALVSYISNNNHERENKGITHNSSRSPAIATSKAESQAGAQGDVVTAVAGDIILPTVSAGPVENLRVVGASAELAGSEVDLAENPRRDDLHGLLHDLNRAHPLIIIDTPPSLSLLTVNALVAAHQLIIPVQCEYYALEGLGQLLRTTERIKRSLNPSLQVLGLVRTMYDGRLGLSSQVSHELEAHFPNLVFSTIIPRSVRLAEAPSYGQPIALYDRKSAGADAYQRLSVEVLDRIGLSSRKTTRQPRVKHTTK